MARFLAAALEVRATVIIEVDPETNHISGISEELADNEWKNADGSVNRAAIQNLYKWDTEGTDNTLNDYWAIYFTQETPDSSIVEVEPVPNPQWDDEPLNE